MVTDYWVVRRGKGLNLRGLYEPHGPYWFWKGVNWRAMFAIAVGIGLNMPGLLYMMGVKVSNKGILNYYCVTWVSGVIVSGIVYGLVNLVIKPPSPGNLDVYLADKDGIIRLSQSESISLDIGSISEKQEPATTVAQDEY